MLLRELAKLKLTGALLEDLPREPTQVFPSQLKLELAALFSVDEAVLSLIMAPETIHGLFQNYLIVSPNRFRPPSQMGTARVP